MLKQQKANTATVPCALGGGTNGYLGILLLAITYNMVAPGIPVMPPLMPGALIINPTDTQYQIAIAKKLYKTAIREHQT